MTGTSFDLYRPGGVDVLIGLPVEARQEVDYQLRALGKWQA